MECQYQENFVVPESICDAYGQAPLSYLLKTAQDVSSEHCNHIHLGKEIMDSFHRVFLLAKIQAKVERLPLGGETIQVVTKPYLPYRFTYPRFTFFYQQDELLATLDSRWILVDTDTWKITRQPPAGMELPFPALSDPSDFRLSPLKESTFLEKVQVRYSMTDVNHHMNNAVYADLACNAIEQELFAGRHIASFTIQYHREAKFGETISLYQKKEENRYFLEGQLGDAACFESLLELAPEK